MSLDTAKAIAKLRSLTKRFDTTVQAATPFYPQLCKVIPSDGFDEEYGLLGAVPGMRQWLGDRIFHSLRGAKFTIENKSWENSVEIERERIEDDRLGIYQTVFEDLAVEAAYHPDELLFQELILNGHQEACFDGQYFFDDDHVWGDSGSQSNLLTFDASDHTAVTTAEFKSAFHEAVIALSSYKNDQGKFLNRPVMHDGLSGYLVLVSQAMLPTAITALKAELVGGGDSNVLMAMPKVMSSPYLTSDVDVYTFNLRGQIRPFVFQARRPITRQMKGVDDREFKDVKFMCDARYNLGYGAWWTAVKTTFN